MLWIDPTVAFFPLWWQMTSSQDGDGWGEGPAVVAVVRWWILATAFPKTWPNEHSVVRRSHNEEIGKLLTYLLAELVEYHPATL